MNTPYFLWDYDLTEKDVVKILHSKNQEEKSWLTTRILESAKYEDIWRFLTLRQVKEIYPSLKLKKPVYTTDDIFRPAQQVLSRAELSHKVTMLAIGVFNLCPMFKQPELFFRPDLNLSEAMDQINGRYGSQMIYRGLLWKTENLAKDRIGFRKIDF